MPVPPPPPPPAPPPAPPAQSRTDPPKIQRSEGGGRSALLSDIQKGTRLKKVTQVNDRSTPFLDKPKVNSVDGSGRNVAAGNSTNTAGSAASAVGPTLGGLFAGGFPVLKPVGQRDKLQHNTVSRSGSTASLKQPLWNPPSQGDGFRGSAPDLSPSHKPLERASSLSKTRPISSYTAPPSPSQTSHPCFKLSSTPPSSAPPPPPPPQERPSNRPPPLPTCPPPPPPPQTAKPTWLPVQSHSIPMPTTPLPPLPPSVPAYSLPDRSSGVFYPPPPPPPPSVPPSSLPDRSSGVFYPPPPPPPAPSSFSNKSSGVFPPPPSPGPFEMKDSPLGPPPPPPPPLPASFACSHPSSAPPPLPQKVPPMPSPTYRPSVPPLPPSYPCTAPSRRPPAVPRFAGAPRMAPPPAPPARSPNTELSSRFPPPPPLPLSAPPSTVRNGHLHSLDDFESKFHFHPIEDFPPPEEFRPFPRTYPSKENRVNPQPPAMRTHLR
ncbi:WAS/WASL-interacting protein family member 3 isoform X1 [Carassius auratus]|uniref:WAS/WASL-interacting protein family member 3-like isoform X1 n=1 Tax=Carassius auratus TaxID=7957 RepID=A0A6P6RKL0_CARAU|nr:WAS/WASL-interacting protein family member 3-like isoform X1 [Carassius auratus]XP_026145678.1 WAS/WASL-interacting protein family member 3-like isoform X1 [Carassius auratus]XP_026145679.1 WAS/WASL-interacting protein family member 3-like isoform X1 [Carassius auratus]